MLVSYEEVSRFFELRAAEKGHFFTFFTLVQMEVEYLNAIYSKMGYTIFMAWLFFKRFYYELSIFADSVI